MNRRQRKSTEVNGSIHVTNKTKRNKMRIIGKVWCSVLFSFSRFSSAAVENLFKISSNQDFILKVKSCSP